MYPEKKSQKWWGEDTVSGTFTFKWSSTLGRPAQNTREKLARIQLFIKQKLRTRWVPPVTCDFVNAKRRQSFQKRINCCQHSEENEWMKKALLWHITGKYKHKVHMGSSSFTKTTIRAIFQCNITPSIILRHSYLQKPLPTSQDKSWTEQYWSTNSSSEFSGDTVTLQT